MAIEDLGDVVGVDAFELERDWADALTVRGRPEDAQAGDLGHPRERVARDPALVVVGGLHPDLVDPAQRRGEADRLRDRRGAGLEAGGRIGVGRPLRGHLADHRATAEERRHLGEQLQPPPERADPGRPVGLVPGEGVEVDPELGDVNRQLRRRLRPVDEHQGACRVGQLGDLGDRVERAEHVRDVGHRDELRLAGERGLEVLADQRSVVVDADPVDLGAHGLGELLPGNDVGVVLHHGQHQPIAGSDVRLAPRSRHQVDRLGRVADEDQLATVAGAEVVGDGGSRALVGRGGLGRERVRSAMDVRVMTPLVSVDGLDRSEHALRARSRVEIDQRLVADPPAQRREEGPDPLHVERFGCLRDRCHRGFRDAVRPSPRPLP